MNLAMAAGARADYTLLQADGTPVSIVVSAVDEGFFPLFDLPLAIGGGFTPEYFRKNGPDGAVLSYRLWRGAFGGDPHIVGKTLTLTRKRADPRRGGARNGRAARNGRVAQSSTRSQHHESRVRRVSAGASVDVGGRPVAAAGGGGCRPRPRFSWTRRQPRVRRCAFRRDDGWRSAADADHRVVGDGAAASARVCQRGESAAGACVAALARDRDPRCRSAPVAVESPRSC